MVIYIILGALMDELAVTLITIPVILPSLSAMPIDLVWFGILFVINQQMGLILPPVGMIVFYSLRNAPRSLYVYYPQRNNAICCNYVHMYYFGNAGC